MFIHKLIPRNGVWQIQDSQIWNWQRLEIFQISSWEVGILLSGSKAVAYCSWNSKHSSPAACIKTSAEGHTVVDFCQLTVELLHKMFHWLKNWHRQLEWGYLYKLYLFFNSPKCDDVALCKCSQLECKEVRVSVMFSQRSEKRGFTALNSPCCLLSKLWTAGVEQNARENEPSL